MNISEYHNDYIYVNRHLGVSERQWRSRCEPTEPAGEKKHLQYLKVHKQFIYHNLSTSGRLNEYLTNVDEQAEDMFFRLVKEYADRKGVTERL